MFAWISTVFASSGFVHGEVWAAEKDRNWQALKAAFSVWWPVTVARVPHRRCSVFLGRHPAFGRWSGRVWIVGGLAAVAWYGPGPLVAVSPVPMPGVVGVILAFGTLVAFVLLVPRVRGLVVLRPGKAAVLVAVLGAVYWALTAVTFHYGFGVDVWSSQLWAELAEVWYGGGNLRWSAFWLLAADTFAWAVVGMFVWARAARVWIAVKRWGVWLMEWVLRAVVFFVISYTALRFWDYGWWQIVDRLARTLATVPGASEVVEHAPGWAILVVLFVFGLVLVNLFSVVLVSVSDFLCWLTRMFAIAVYGERIAPSANDAGDVQPRRFVGLLERLDRRQLKAAERYQAYLRQRLIDAVESGITPEGWREDLEEDEERWAREDAEAGPSRRRRWWPFRAKDEPGEELAPGSVQSPAAAAGAALGEAAPEGVEEPVPEAAQDPVVERPPESADDVAVPDLGDTTERDKDLAPDPDEDDLDRLSPDAAIGRGPSFDDGLEPVEDAVPEGQSVVVADPDREHAVLREAKAAEQGSWQSGGGEDHRHEVEQARMEARAEDDFAYYDDGSDELSDFGQPDGDPDQYEDAWQGPVSTVVDGWAGGVLTPPESFGDPFAPRSDAAGEDGEERVGEDVGEGLDAEVDWAARGDGGGPDEGWPERSADGGAVAMDHGDPEDSGPAAGDALGVPVTGAEEEFEDVRPVGAGGSGAESSGRMSALDPVADPRPDDGVAEGPRDGDEAGRGAPADGLVGGEGAGIEVDDDIPPRPASLHDPLLGTYGVVRSRDGGAVAQGEGDRLSAPAGGIDPERAARVAGADPLGGDVPVPPQDWSPVASRLPSAATRASAGGGVAGPPAGEGGVGEGSVSEGAVGPVVEREEASAAGVRRPEREADRAPGGAEESHGSEVGRRPI